MVVPSPKPDGSLAVALAQDIRGFSRTLKRRLRDQADSGDLTPNQVSVIVRLDKDGPATTSGLARAEGMRPQSMGAIIAALETAGLIKTSIDPKDGRQTLLSLTADCHQMLHQGRAARQDWLSQTIETRLSPAEQDQLAAAMALLQRLTSD